MRTSAITAVRASGPLAALQPERSLLREQETRKLRWIKGSSRSLGDPGRVKIRKGAHGGESYSTGATRIRTSYHLLARTLRWRGRSRAFILHLRTDAPTQLS